MHGFKYLIPIYTSNIVSDFEGVINLIISPDMRANIASIVDIAYIDGHIAHSDVKNNWPISTVILISKL